MVMKKLLSIGIVVLMIFCFSGCKERYEFYEIKKTYGEYVKKCDQR